LLEVFFRAFVAQPLPEIITVLKQRQQLQPFSYVRGHFQAILTWGISTLLKNKQI
jgi:hypothetical protein